MTDPDTKLRDMVHAITFGLRAQGKGPEIEHVIRLLDIYSSVVLGESGPYTDAADANRDGRILIALAAAYARDIPADERDDVIGALIALSVIGATFVRIIAEEGARS